MKYDDFEATNKQQIKDHINKNHTLYLWGNYGCGKTHLLKFIQSRFSSKNTIYRMTSELHRELISEIQFNKSTGTQCQSIVSKMCDCDVLLIDDIGNEHMSEFVHEALSVVINTRYFEHNKDNPRPMRTIFTSNYNPRELHNLWSEKIGKGKSLQLVSRLKSFGVIEMKGKNWRA